LAFAAEPGVQAGSVESGAPLEIGDGRTLVALLPEQVAGCYQYGLAVITLRPSHTGLPLTFRTNCFSIRLWTNRFRTTADRRVAVRRSCRSPLPLQASMLSPSGRP